MHIHIGFTTSLINRDISKPLLIGKQVSAELIECKTINIFKRETILSIT